MGTTFELYRRQVKAVNSSVVADIEILVGRRLPSPLLGGVDGGGEVVVEGAGMSARETLGRGPGRGRDVLVQGAGRIRGDGER